MIAVHQAWTWVLRLPPLTTQSHLDPFGEESLVIVSALLCSLAMAVSWNERRE
jgi:hypothetical protein